jgi:hypothetical protein
MAQVRRIAALQVFNSARQMSAELVASAHKTVHISLSRDRARLGSDGAILIERAFAEPARVDHPVTQQYRLQALRNSSASLAILAAISRAW